MLRWNESSAEQASAGYTLALTELAKAALALKMHDAWPAWHNEG